MPCEASELMRPGEDLLSICLAMHMHHTGASDPLRDETFDRYRRILNLAIHHWHDPVHSPQFDECVRNLILATLEECGNNFTPDTKRFPVKNKHLGE